MKFSIAVETKVFNAHIKDFAKKSNLSTGIIIKKFAFDLLARIIRKMPVLFGQARGGWYAAFEALGGSGPRTGTVEEAKGISQGSFIDQTKGTGKDKWVEIINGVGHMLWLEYGWSQQAPFGVVRLSMREMRKGELPQNMTKELQKDWVSFHG